MSGGLNVISEQTQNRPLSYPPCLTLITIQAVFATIQARVVFFVDFSDILLLIMKREVQGYRYMERTSHFKAIQQIEGRISR